MARAIDVRAEEWVVAPMDRELPEDSPERTEWLISHPTPAEAAEAQDQGAEYLAAGVVRVRTGTLDLWACRYYIKDVRKFPDKNGDELELEFAESPNARKKREGKARKNSGTQNSIPVSDDFLSRMGPVLMHQVSSMIMGDVPTESDAEK